MEFIHSHRVALVTKYLGPTNTRGSRIRARRADHRTGDPEVAVLYDYALNTTENHLAAVQALASKLQWDGARGRWVTGGTAEGLVAVFVSL